MTSLCVFVLALLACSRAPAGGPPGEGHARYVAPADLEAKVKSGALADAVFAGGCFWCMEGPFEKTEGVVAAISGYAGGPEPEPSYDQVSGGRTGHTESVRVIYDPKKVTYEQLLAVYWRNIDPTQADGQFCDRGPQYRSAVFYAGDAEKAAAERTKAAAEKALNAKVVTEVLPRGPFWAAENYHQDFYRTNPTRYHSYREGCGRDRRLKQLWGQAQ